AIANGCDIISSDNDNENSSQRFARIIPLTLNGVELDKIKVQAMTGDGEGGWVVTGSFQSPDQETDIFVVHVDKQGTLVWKKRFGSKDSDQPYDIIRTKNGDFVITGIKDKNGLYLLRISRRGKVLW